MVLSHLLKKATGKYKSTNKNRASNAGNRIEDNHTESSVPVLIAVLVGFLFCYILLNYVDNGTRILSKTERATNNFVWDGQVHN